MSGFNGLFQTVTVFIAFILTLLCLFAGTQRNFLEDVDLLTVSPVVSNYSLQVADRQKSDLAPSIHLALYTRSQ